VRLALVGAGESKAESFEPRAAHHAASAAHVTRRIRWGWVGVGGAGEKWLF